MTLGRRVLAGLRTRGPASLAVLGFSLLTATWADAQGPTDPAGGPVSQALPREADGRLTIRAMRASSPHRIDGTLDEADYANVVPVSDFIQMEPAGGQPASERTEVWVFFDDRNVYVTMRAWESRPDLMVVNEMRRDSNNIRMGDCIGFSLDTFHDGRNAFQFEVNPLGARTDGQSTNERQYNADWNPVWDLAVGKFEGGWTVEAALPFKSLRYNPGAGQVWGFNARRNNKWKNEIAYLSRVPPAMGIGRGSFAASLFPTLVGIDAPAVSKNLEIKPYVLGDLTTDRTAVPVESNSPDGNVGLDVKYGLTQSLTADLTVNTDFAQVEADEQQVNLTRFSLFFPEKREFFLENQGTFTFGTSSMGTNQVGDTPLLFYSRRIGLSQGHEVPILAGGRVTGRVGRFTIGAVDIATKKSETAHTEATNFSVLRVRRDVLRRSSVGLLATNRSVAENGDGRNSVIGLDGAFTFFDNLAFNAYWAKTATDGLDGDDVSYRGYMEYAGDRYGVQVERLVVGDNFNPEIGFVRRDDMHKSFGQLRFSPRVPSIAAIRKFSWIGTVTYIEDGAGRLETRTTDGEFAIELENSDRFSVSATDNFELLTSTFVVTPLARIPAGPYDFASAAVAYTFGQQRPVSGNLSIERGAYYNGDLTRVAFGRTRVNVTSQLSFEPNLSLNWIDLPTGSYTNNLVGSRVTYTVTPLMFVSALVQYSSTSRRVSTNARLRWEYQPGSELFVVFNEERDTRPAGFPDLQNRAFIVKINRLFRF